MKLKTLIAAAVAGALALPLAAQAQSSGSGSGSDSASAGGTAASPSGQKFAESLFAACMKTGGSMDEVLGQKS